MTPAEAAVLLARIAASDNREVTESASRAWAESLPDVALCDALDYLPEYYRCATRDRTNWIYPGDVLEGVRKLHAIRRKAACDAARKAFIAAAESDDADTDMHSLRASTQAGREYDMAHQIPAPAATEAPKRPHGWEFG